MLNESRLHRSLTLLGSVALAMGALFGCTGAIGDSNDPAGDHRPGGSGTPGGSSTTGNSGGPTGTGGTGTPPGIPGVPTHPGTGAIPDPTSAGPMPLRRLNRFEYNNTVRDLVGVQTRPADSFPLDFDGFSFHRAGLVSSLDASRLRDAAEQIATSVNASVVGTCAATAAAEDACARTFIGSFGQKAFRRPLVTEETDRLMSLYQTGRTTLKLDYPGAVRLLIEAILQAPPFLYRWELGPSAPILDGKVIRLGPYEVASRLSYFLWGSMPDQPLFDAARANQLGTPAEIDKQARRLLGDPKARGMVASFFEQWLGLDILADIPKSAAVYPEFNDDLKAAMGAETDSFVTNVVFDGDGLLDTLLTAKFSFVDRLVAPIYGLAAVQSTTPQRSALDPAQRAGLLTQAGFLSLTGAPEGSNPVKRGKRILERLLCGSLPPPPANVPPPKAASAGGTTRQRYAEHDQQACAQGCHNVMDPLGFAFEHYDGIGRYRTLDNGLPVDSTGETILGGTKRGFADAVEFGGLLAASQEVRNCFVTQWARFAYARAETDADQASLDRAALAFASANGVVRELLVAVATSRSFLYRSPAAGEVQP